MKFHHVLALATLLIGAQAYSLTATPKNVGCPPEAECEPWEGGTAAGGGEMSTFTGSWMYGGSHWESYEDSQGGFDIETTPDGKVKVHFGNAGAFLIKPAPPASQMRRSKLVTGPFSPAITLAQAKKEADDEKAALAAKAAQEAAAKVAAEKAAAAANKAAGVYSGPAIGSAPAGGGVILGSRKKP